MDEQTYDISGGNNQFVPNANQAVQNFYGDEFAKKILERDQHPITVVVTGAGVDATMGIPTSSALIPRIAEFLETDEGRALDALLRKAIGHVRFHFDKFVEHAIDSLAKNLDRELHDICSNVK